MKHVLTLSIMLLLLTSAGQAQEPDSTELQRLWQECVIPIIERDFAALEHSIPVAPEGDWYIIMGLLDSGLPMNRETFFAHFDKLFDKENREQFRQESWRDIEIYCDEYDGWRLVIGVGWEEDGNEWGARIHYQKVDGAWRMTMIYGVG